MLDVPTSLTNRVANRTGIVMAEPVEATLPVSVATAKTFMRVDGTDEDVLILTMLLAATALVERYIGGPIVRRSCQVILDRFPGFQSAPLNDIQATLSDSSVINASFVQLPLKPWASITSVTYVDKSGNSNTWASTSYFLDTATQRLCLKDGYSWPVTRDLQGVTITGSVGHAADIASAPSSLVFAVLAVVAKFYESRGQCAEHEAIGPAKHLLAPYRIVVSGGML